MFGVPVTGITDARVTYWLAIDLARCLPWGNATRKGGAAMSERLGWARVVGDVNMSVRRGAWYEVTRLTHEAATLDVHHETRSVPRSTVEIVTSRPRRWSAVSPRCPARGAVRSRRFPSNPPHVHRGCNATAAAPGAVEQVGTTV